MTMDTFGIPRLGFFPHERRRGPFFIHTGSGHRVGGFLTVLHILQLHVHPGCQHKQGSVWKKTPRILVNLEILRNMAYKIDDKLTKELKKHYTHKIYTNTATKCPVMRLCTSINASATNFFFNLTPWTCTVKPFELLQRQILQYLKNRQKKPHKFMNFFKNLSEYFLLTLRFKNL